MKRWTISLLATAVAPVLLAVSGCGSSPTIATGVAAQTAEATAIPPAPSQLATLAPAATPAPTATPAPATPVPTPAKTPAPPPPPPPPPPAPAAPAPPPAAPAAPDAHQAAYDAGATAICADGSYSFSAHRSGTCSSHGGVHWWTGRVGAPGPGAH